MIRVQVVTAAHWIKCRVDAINIFQFTEFRRDGSHVIFLSKPRISMSSSSQNDYLRGMIMKRINKVAILGAGTMGARIAAHFANAGVPSYLLDIVPPDADGPARNKIAAAGLDAAKKSKPAAFMEPSLARLVTVGNFEDDLKKLADVDWIIEAVVENLEIKRSLLRKVEAIRKPGTIITTNTSGLPVGKIAEGFSRRLSQGLVRHALF